MPLPISLIRLDPGQLDDHDDLEILVKSPQLRLYEGAYGKRGPLSEEGKHFLYRVQFL